MNKLFKEIEEYKESKKKLKVFRIEDVLAEFKKARQERNYAVADNISQQRLGRRSQVTHLVRQGNNNNRR